MLYLLLEQTLEILVTYKIPQVNIKHGEIVEMKREEAGMRIENKYFPMSKME